MKLLKSRLLTRLVIVLAVIWFSVLATCLGSGWNAFFKQLGKDPIGYDALQLTDVEKGIAVQGECAIVYDLIGYGYTETTSRYTGRKSTTTDNYYWLVNCDDDDGLMLVKTRANDSISDSMSDMVEALWSAESLEEYADMIGIPVELDGVFIKNDPEIVQFYNEWIQEMSADDPEWADCTLAPYTLDCTMPFAGRMRGFRIGVIMIVITIGAAAAGIVLFVKKSRGGAASPQPAYAGVPSGGPLVGDTGSVTAYGTTGGAYETFNSSMTAGKSESFQSQGRTSQTSGSTGGTPVNSYGTYASQNNSGTNYGSTQSTSSGSTGGYGTSSYGIYASQNNSGMNYGSTQSDPGLNYGSMQSTSSYGYDSYSQQNKSGAVYDPSGNSNYGGFSQ